MSNSGPLRNKSPGKSSSTPEEDSLLEILPDEGILTNVKRRKKHGVDGFLDDLTTPNQARARIQVGGNVGLALGVEANGERYIAIDEEDAGVLPDEAAALVDTHARATWTSPHGGRNRMVSVSPKAFDILDSAKTGIDLDGDDEDELEILISGHSLIPPSTIDHGHCKTSKPCDGKGADSYGLIDLDPDAPILTEDTTMQFLDLLDLKPEKGTTTGDYSEEHSHSSEGTDYQNFDLPETNGSHQRNGEETLRTLQKQAVTPFKILVDLLSGGDGKGVYQSLLWTKTDDGEWVLNHSLQAEVAISRLYEAVRFLTEADPEEAQAIAVATYEDYVDENPEADDDHERKWRQTGDLYKKSTLSNAIDRCDRGKFQRFLNRTTTEDEDDEDRFGGGRAHVTDQMPLAALKILTGHWTSVEEGQYAAVLHHGLDLDRASLKEAFTHFSPSLSVQGLNPPGCGPPKEPGPSSLTDGGSERTKPTKTEVEELCRLLDDADHVEGTIEAEYGNALSEHVGNGSVKLAKCWSRPNGDRYVYYLKSQPDPEDADKVSTMGEKYDPEVADGINSWTGEPESSEASETEQQMMTDGGTRTDDTEEDVDKLSHTTEDLDGSGRRSPAVFACPIKGCSRIVIDNPGDLRNHVAQETDEAHRYRTLNEDLEVVTQWEAMNWGWGAPK